MGDRTTKELKLSEREAAAMGQRLAKTAELRGWDYKKLAAAMDITPQHALNLFKGKGSLAAYARACHVLAASMDYIVLGHEPFKDDPELSAIIRAVQTARATR